MLQRERSIDGERYLARQRRRGASRHA
jgi:hypothetical protein